MLDEDLNKYEDLIKRSDRVSATYDVLVKQEKSYKEEIEESREEILVLEKVEELFKFLLDKYVHKYAESFSEIVTEGLQTIFHDQDISFDVAVDQKRGKVWVDFETVEDGIRGQCLQSFGGGVTSVESLLLRLLVLLKKKLARYLILDESLAALSSDYVPNAGEFIQKMCDELDIDVLLITHNKSFLEYADTAYEATLDNSGALVLSKQSN